MLLRWNTTSLISFAFRISGTLVLLWSQVAVLLGGERNQWGKPEQTCLSGQLWCRGERKGNCNLRKCPERLWTERGIFKGTHQYFTTFSSARAEEKVFVFSFFLNFQGRTKNSHPWCRLSVKKSSCNQSWGAKGSCSGRGSPNVKCGDTQWKCKTRK